MTRQAPVRLTRRGVIVAAGAAVAVFCALPGDPPLPNTGCPSVIVYEDGSGVQYDAKDRELRTFPEGTFAWPEDRRPVPARCG